MFRRLLVMAGLTAIPALGQAQTSGDSVAIVEAATRWYAMQMPKKDAQVGFLLPSGPRAHPEPTTSQLQAAEHGARILHATLIPFDSLTSKLCDRTKAGECGPGKFDVVVEVHPNKTSGNTSEVFVVQSTRLGAGPRLRHVVHGWTLLLVRSTDGWAFSRVLSTSAS